MPKFYNVPGGLARANEGALLDGKWEYDRHGPLGPVELFSFGLERLEREAREFSLRHDVNSPFGRPHEWVWPKGERPLVGSEWIASKPLSLQEMGR